VLARVTRVPGALTAWSPHAVVRSPATRWRQGVPREHQWGLGVASGKAFGGGAHPNGGAAWRRWRSLETAAFVGRERALVAGGDGGATVQCQCKKGKVRAFSIGDNGGGWKGLTVMRRRRWRSAGNRRGGVSGGGN
jgi:hypothetical protein